MTARDRGAGRCSVNASAPVPDRSCLLRSNRRAATRLHLPGLFCPPRSPPPPTPPGFLPRVSLRYRLFTPLLSALPHPSVSFALFSFFRSPTCTRSPYHRPCASPPRPRLHAFCPSVLKPPQTSPECADRTFDRRDPSSAALAECGAGDDLTRLFSCVPPPTPAFSSSPPPCSPLPPLFFTLSSLPLRLPPVDFPALTCRGTTPAR